MSDEKSNRDEEKSDAGSGKRETNVWKSAK